MSRLRIGFDFYSAHCYHLILIGEPIFSAFVLQREAAFRVCLAFLQLPPSSIAGIINSTLLPRCQASTLPQLIWSSSQREGWGFPPRPHWPRFKQPQARGRGTPGGLTGPCGVTTGHLGDCPLGCLVPSQASSVAPVNAGWRPQRTFSGTICGSCHADPPPSLQTSPTWILQHLQVIPAVGIGPGVTETFLPLGV